MTEDTLRLVDELDLWEDAASNPWFKERDHLHFTTWRRQRRLARRLKTRLSH